PYRATPGTLRALTVADRDYLLLALRRLTYGERIALVLTCPREGCGARMDVDVTIDDIPVEPRPIEPRYHLALPGPDGAPRPVEIAALSPESRDAIEREIELRSPRVELEMGTACPECGHELEAAIDPAGLVIDEVRRGRASFDREIHTLALHYHWPLRELLGM